MSPSPASPPVTVAVPVELAHPTPWQTMQCGKSKRFWVEDARGYLVLDELMDEYTAHLIVDAVNTREKAKEYVKAMHPLVASPTPAEREVKEKE